VEQRVIDTGRELTADADLVADLRSRINSASVGQPLPSVPARLDVLVDGVAPEDRPVATAVARALADAVAEQAEERIFLSGTANLARSGNDFPTSLSAVLDALEEHVVLLRLMGSMATLADGDQVAVSIGMENPYEPLRTTSVVATSYGDAGGLGVVGPTRMDYPQAMAAVRAVARYVAEILDG
jgi:heat-inducible transcriptional repressor